MHCNHVLLQMYNNTLEHKNIIIKTLCLHTSAITLLDTKLPVESAKHIKKLSQQSAAHLNNEHYDQDFMPS